MALIDSVKDVCDRLQSKGWRDLLLAATSGELDISQTSRAKLLKELTKELTAIDRTVSGFEDFHLGGDQGVVAGRPSQSLLYHALASPNVHPTADGEPSSRQSDYASLDELDDIENFIFSLDADRDDLDDTFIAVFAYQYRVSGRTSHRRHADLTYSRTGVSRIGTAKSNYDRSRRSFWVVPRGTQDALAVLPARYGVFLARRSKPGAAGSVQGGHNGLADDDFVFPVHKLFEGKECLKGRDLEIDFAEFHRNEKLRMTHRLPQSNGGLPVPDGFDTNALPYVRDSENGGDLCSLKKAGATVLVEPAVNKTIIRTVTQKNSVANRNQIVHFEVPARTVVRNRPTRFVESTLEIPAFGSDRLSPEYVNIRHKIDPAGPVSQTPEDLNELSRAAFDNTMRDGGYTAAHFTDDSCDGCVEATVKGLRDPVDNLPAFSLITAPDFFPLADQLEVATDQSIGRTEPLSRGRLPVNPTLHRPGDRFSFAFDRSDTTVTAIVGAAAVGTTPIVGHPNRMISFLPDAASNVFAPGWDTSRSRDSVSSFLTSSGLGSPFPEDAKLCAALASFWPAVAPDNGRTFGNQGFGNQLPMLDEELGFHPKHERVKSGEVNSFTGWDGEFGPFFETVSRKLHVNYVDISRSDYVSNSLAGTIRVSLTAEIQSEELIARHQALSVCQLVLETGSTPCLVVVRKVDDWQSFGTGSTPLTGGGYLMEFAEFRCNPKSTSERSRVRHEVQKKHICHVASNGIGYKNGSSRMQFFRLP